MGWFGRKKGWNTWKSNCAKERDGPTTSMACTISSWKAKSVKYALHIRDASTRVGLN